MRKSPFLATCFFRICLPALGGFVFTGGALLPAVPTAEARPLRRPKAHALLVDLTHIEATNGERDDQKTAQVIEQQIIGTRMALLRVLSGEQPLHVALRTVASNLYLMAAYNSRARENDDELVARVAGSIEQMRLRVEQTMMTIGGQSGPLPPLPADYRRPARLYTPEPYVPPGYNQPPPPPPYNPQLERPTYVQPPPPPPPVYGPPTYPPMAPAQFATLLEQMQRLSWGEEKIRLAQDAANSGNYFSCQQIVQLMATASWGEEKVKIAAALYPRAVDPQSFTLLTGALQWETERQQLRRLIGK